MKGLSNQELKALRHAAKALTDHCDKHEAAATVRKAAGLSFRRRKGRAI